MMCEQRGRQSSAVVFCCGSLQGSSPARAWFFSSMQPTSHPAPPPFAQNPQLPPGSVDVEILHDATRREAKGG
jgi:hypothetical protein